MQFLYDDERRRGKITFWVGKVFSQQVLEKSSFFKGASAISILFRKGTKMRSCSLSSAREQPLPRTCSCTSTHTYTHTSFTRRQTTKNKYLSTRMGIFHFTFDVPVQFSFAMQIIQSLQHLSQNNGDMHFFEVASFHQVQRRTTSKVFHNNP